MKRRDFLGMAAKGALGATALGIVGCANGEETAAVVDQAQDTANEVAEVISSESGFPEITWEVATSWPLALDTIFGGAEIFANRVSQITGGKFNITARAAGELAPGLEVLKRCRARVCSHWSHCFLLLRRKKPCYRLRHSLALWSNCPPTKCLALRRGWFATHA